MNKKLIPVLLVASFMTGCTFNYKSIYNHNEGDKNAISTTGNEAMPANSFVEDLCGSFNCSDINASLNPIAALSGQYTGALSPNCPWYKKIIGRCPKNPRASGFTAQQNPSVASDEALKDLDIEGNDAVRNEVLDLLETN